MNINSTHMRIRFDLRSILRREEIDHLIERHDEEEFD
jgi:hypothetical protein